MLPKVDRKNNLKESKRTELSEKSPQKQKGGMACFKKFYHY